MKPRRYMHNPRTERRVINGALWLVMACILAAIVTSCSPYAVTSENFTELKATPSPSATATQGFEKIQNPTPTPRPSCVTVGYLNVRTAPGTAARVLFTLRPGERVTVIEQFVTGDKLNAGAWHKVQAGNRPGYIYSKFCK